MANYGPNGASPTDMAHGRNKHFVFEKQSKLVKKSRSEFRRCLQHVLVQLQSIPICYRKVHLAGQTPAHAEMVHWVAFSELPPAPPNVRPFPPLGGGVDVRAWQIPAAFDCVCVGMNISINGNECNCLWVCMDLNLHGRCV